MLFCIPSDPSHKENEQVFTEAKKCGEKKEPHWENVRNTGCYIRVTCMIWQSLLNQVPATPPAPNIFTNENSPWEPTFPDGTVPLRAGHALSPTAAAVTRQQKPTIVLFLSLFSINSPKHSAASQASQGLCSETKHLSTYEKPPQWGSFPRACQPGARSPLVSVSHSSHTYTLYMTSYRPGREQELLLKALFLISLSFAMVLYQQDALRCPSSSTAIPNQTDRLKASMPFWESSHHTGTHDQFWYRGKYP